MLQQSIRPEKVALRNQTNQDVARFIACGGKIHTDKPPEVWPVPKPPAPLAQPMPTRNISLEGFRELPEHPKMWINQQGQVWSEYKKGFLPITGRSRKVRLHTGLESGYVRLCVDDLVERVFG